MKKVMKMPTYLKDFRCIAEKCEDTCCVGFAVPVDKNTFKKYENIEDGRFKNDLGKHVEKNPKSTSDGDYSYINATCACPFLGEDGLCGIQKNLGESFLSSACSKYPKHISVVDNHGEKWATLSCPEIARLVLLNKNGLEFEEREEELDLERDIATFQLQTESLPMTKYFYELRQFTIDVLQDKSLNLDIRMVILKEFYKDMHELVGNGAERDIPTLLASYKEHRKFTISDAEFNLDLFFERLVEFSQKNTFVHRYERVFYEMIKGFEGEINPVGLEFIEQNSYLLENYLVHYVFQRLYPFSYGESVYDSYKMLELNYDLLRVHIMGVGSHLGYMDETEVVRVVQSFVKEAEHNTIFLPTFFSDLTSD